MHRMEVYRQTCPVRTFPLPSQDNAFEVKKHTTSWLQSLHLMPTLFAPGTDMGCEGQE